MLNAKNAMRSVRVLDAHMDAVVDTGIKGNRRARRASIARRRAAALTKDNPVDKLNERLVGCVLHPTRGFRMKSVRSSVAAAIVEDIMAGGLYSTKRMSDIMKGVQM